MSLYLHCCEDLRKAVEDKDTAITYTAKFREYGISILDGGSSRLHICYCPWCGKPLPASLRHQWYDALERLGLDPDQGVPEEFQDERWYQHSSEH